ncbi:MAG: biotin transporter BioY [Oscillospiraceae bacterium]|nr:biotin transporter BioY [Oscillospiraceae bacterium]
MKTKTAFTVREMVFTALFAAVICAIAPFAVPIGPVPITLGSFGVYLAAAVLGPKFGSISVALYISLGAIGLPVFSNFNGGFHVITGPTGGFLMGFIPCALATGFVIDFCEKRIKTVNSVVRIVLTYISYALGMVIGTILLYTGGAAWFMVTTGNTLRATLSMTAVPFLFGDALKIAAVCIIAPQVRSMIKWRRWQK